MTKNCNESKVVNRKKSYAFPSWCSHSVAFCLDCHESPKISQQRTQTPFPPSWSEGWETLGALQRTALSLEVWSWRQVRERTGSQWFGSFFFYVVHTAAYLLDTKLLFCFVYLFKCSPLNLFSQSRASISTGDLVSWERTGIVVLPLLSAGAVRWQPADSKDICKRIAVSHRG